MSAAHKASDTQFTESVIDKVEPGEKWFTVTADGWSISFEKKPGIVPRVGSVMRQYGRGIGYPVRGIDIDGREVYYRTAAQDEAKHAADVAESQRKKREDFEANIAKHDALYEALPVELMRRVDGFRATSPDWRWRFEAYEVFACTEAQKIALACRTKDEVEKFAAASLEQQKERIPRLAYAEHSGNTFGMACRLAWLLVSRPEIVHLEHGALCPIVGCAEYGCAPSRKEPRS